LAAGIIPPLKQPTTASISTGRRHCRRGDRQVGEPGAEDRNQQYPPVADLVRDGANQKAATALVIASAAATMPASLAPVDVDRGPTRRGGSAAGKRPSSR
jgi:hypothetical protein